MTVKLVPLYDNVVIEVQDNNDANTNSMIHIPESAKKESTIGKVLAVGPGTQSPEGKFIPIGVKEGQRIAFRKWGANKVEINKNEFTVIKGSDIIGIIEE